MGYFYGSGTVEMLKNAIAAQECNRNLNSRDWDGLTEYNRRKALEESSCSYNDFLKSPIKETENSEVVICYSKTELDELFRIFGYNDRNAFENLLVDYKPRSVDKIEKDMYDSKPCFPLYRTLIIEKKQNLANAFALSLETLDKVLRSCMTLDEYLNQQKNCILTFRPRS